MVIYDDYLGIVCIVSHPRDETRLKIRTFLPKTGVRSGIYAVPEREVFRKVGQFGAIARLRLVEPFTNDAKMIDVVNAVEDRLVAGVRDAIDTRVIRTALHIGGLEFRGQSFLQEREILLHQLFLKVLCTGGDDDPAFALYGGSDGRYQVGERFACSRACFDDQMLLLVERLGYLFGHFDLAFAVFVSLVKLRYKAAGREHPFTAVLFFCLCHCRDVDCIQVSDKLFCSR